MDDLGGKPTIFGNTHISGTVRPLQIVPPFEAKDLRVFSRLQALRSLPKYTVNVNKDVCTRWFIVTFWFPSWRPLNLWKRHLTIAKKVTKSFIYFICILRSSIIMIIHPPLWETPGFIYGTANCSQMSLPWIAAWAHVQPRSDGRKHWN